tara:strand:- start:2890 stop:3300 length:411 start_codon:yes stop_codon:yes gene_type:complete
MTFIQNHHLKIFVGFDKIFNEIDQAVSDKVSSNLAYDIIKCNDNNYEINVALAGIKEHQIQLNLSNDILTIKIDNKIYKEYFEVIHKGISTKVVNQSFRLEQNIEVTEAILRNGILSIKLYKSLQEKKIRKIIPIK